VLKSVAGAQPAVAVVAEDPGHALPGVGDLLERDAAVEAHPVADSEPGGGAAKLLLAISAAEEVEGGREGGALAGQDGQSLHDVLEAVQGGERARVDQAQRAVGHERPLRVPPGVEPGENGPVVDDGKLPGGDPEGQEPLVAGLRHRDGAGRRRDRETLCCREPGDQEGAGRPGPAGPEELRGRLVEVEDDRDPEEAKGQGGEDE